MTKFEPALNRLIFYIREHLGVETEPEELEKKLKEILEQRDNFYYIKGYEDAVRDNKKFLE